VASGTDTAIAIRATLVSILPPHRIYFKSCILTTKEFVTKFDNLSMMEILNLTMNEDRIRTMKLAFKGDALEMVIADLKFDGNHLAVDIVVPDARIKQLFEDEIYDFLYRFKKNRYIVSSLDIHTGAVVQSAKENSSQMKNIKEKWLKIMNPEIVSGKLDVFA